MNTAFESEKNKKAFIYTSIICGVLLLLFFIIRWTVEPPTVPLVQDLIEINLGNNEEGFGKEQPLIKGEGTPSREAAVAPKQATQPEAIPEKVDPDDNAEATAAPVTKPVKTITKPRVEKVTTPVPVPAAKPQKPKITYNRPGTTPGNNPTEDNGYRMQGKDPNGKNDHGVPTGDKDSYGNTPGGKTGGPKIISGNRKFINYYSFTGELPKATIYAVIKVSPAGQGTLVRLVKPSTSFDQGYATSISTYLRKMLFDKAADESTVTVQFNFNVN